LMGSAFQGRNASSAEPVRGLAPLWPQASRYGVFPIS
jgi:hypothetical protein